MARVRHNIGIDRYSVGVCFPISLCLFLCVSLSLTYSLLLSIYLYLETLIPAYSLPISFSLFLYLLVFQSSGVPVSLCASLSLSLLFNLFSLLRRRYFQRFLSPTLSLWTHLLVLPRSVFPYLSVSLYVRLSLSRLLPLTLHPSLFSVYVSRMMVFYYLSSVCENVYTTIKLLISQIETRTVPYIFPLFFICLSPRLYFSFIVSVSRMMFFFYSVCENVYKSIASSVLSHKLTQGRFYLSLFSVLYLSLSLTLHLSLFSCMMFFSLCK